MANYEFWYCDEVGNRITYMDNVGPFSFVKVIGDIGILSANFPRFNRVFEQTERDNRIHVYRQPVNGSLSLEFVALLNIFSYRTNARGMESVILEGDDQNTLLARRFAAFYAGQSTTDKTDNADDMMKEIVTENLINNADYSGTPTLTRSLSALGLTVQSDLSDGPSIEKGFSWRNVLTILQEIQASAKSVDSEVFFGIVPTSPTTLQFQTKTGQWGNDRTVTSGTNPVVFSLERGNLLNPELRYDYATEANKVYAVGQGQEDQRVVQAKQSNTRIQSSIGGLRERVVYSRGATTTPVLNDAEDELARLRPRPILTGTIMDAPLSRYGLDWDVGDKATVNYAGVQFDILIRSVGVSVDANGKETVTARVEDVS